MPDAANKSHHYIAGATCIRRRKSLARVCCGLLKNALREASSSTRPLSMNRIRVLTSRANCIVLRGNPVTTVAAGLSAVILLAMFAPWIVPYDPVASDVPQALQPPDAAHWAGTDQLGRDILSRILTAARLDLFIAVVAVGLSFVVGAVIGGYCGYKGGRLDRWVGRVVDVLMAFPLFVLAMALVDAMGNRMENIIIATAIINLPFYTRSARAEVNVRRNSGWVEAARACGEGHLSVVLTFLLPQRPSRHGGADIAEPGMGHPERRRPVVHWPGRAGADAGMGHHGGRGRAFHHHRQNGGWSPFRASR